MLIDQRTMLSICLITITLFIFPMIYPYVAVPLVAYLNYRPLVLAM